jgi:catechol-2,3-dioxygenase
MQLKAIVFKTSRLKETRVFFESVLGMKIRENSLTHFVIHAGDIRILFVETNTDPEVEWYCSKKTGGGIILLKDPNQIKIIIIQGK